MFLLKETICWSASDLTAASECEFALLRRLDAKLGRAERVVDVDPLMQHIARLGDAHEARILEALLADPAQRVVRLARARTQEPALRDLHAATLEAFAADAHVVFQAGFYDGEFHGYADFIRRTGEGWVVADAKLARQARPKALLQLGAYVDQLQRAGIAVAPTCELLLGNGRTESFPVAEVMPVFCDRRERLRTLLAEHHAADGPVGWGDDRYLACGRCSECAAQAKATEDVILVAGLRVDQRKRLREVGVHTVTELVQLADAPDGLSTPTFENLRAQARLQLEQLRAPLRDDGAPTVSWELRAQAAETLATLPTPSPGDLFFDFEGDPLYNEGDLDRWGLEYLWGYLEPASSSQQAADPAASRGEFHALWAHDSGQEAVALAQFLDVVVARRSSHPGMHVYHYAPYETTALKRLAARYETRERELDDLLRAGVFVDLYATVRGAIRVSQPSYSIKKLEPLYMGGQLRTGDVQAGDASIVEYHDYRLLAEVDDHEANARLAALAEYNEYDCLSTLRLRDWLLDRRSGDLALTTVGAAADTNQSADSDVLEGSAKADLEHDVTHRELVQRSGPALRADRTPDEQIYAMLASAMGYFRREQRPFWWSHFERLQHRVEDWFPIRDIFRVKSAEVVSDWAKEGRQRNLRRATRLVGDWGPGSTPGTECTTVYDADDGPGYVQVPERCLLGWAKAQIELDPTDARVLTVTETAKPDQIGPGLPVALAPGMPPSSASIEDAVRDVAAAAAATSSLPQSAAIDVLGRRAPRLSDGGPLPRSGGNVHDVVAALLNMESSYVAVQGPPGSGKTWTGARVIKELVESHGWRVGVVAQSHATVEHLLDSVVGAGLDPALVGKKESRRGDPVWTEVTKPESHLVDHAGTGCVLGGTAWTFTSRKVLEAGPLDLLVIDEAGQFALAPTIGVSLGAKRLLLLGDPQQLPQVSQGTHGEPVDTSALGWLMAGHDTIPVELGYFLERSFRMHGTLCARVSRLAYDGRLQADEVADARHLEGVGPGVSVVEVRHRDNRTESIEEARAVVEQVRAHLGARWTDPSGSTGPRALAETDFLVVAPYNAQVNLIRRELATAGFGVVRVGTVDKFQGQEAP
ncbi:MAG: TM0106 family RecB-like putative nuclease, partial [Ornithinibacter sp.]